MQEEAAYLGDALDLFRIGVTRLDIKGLAVSDHMFGDLVGAPSLLLLGTLRTIGGDHAEGPDIDTHKTSFPVAAFASSRSIFMSEPCSGAKKCGPE